MVRTQRCSCIGGILIGIGITLPQLGCAGYNPLARLSNSETLPHLARSQSPDPERRRKTFFGEASSAGTRKAPSKFFGLADTSFGKKISSVFQANRGISDRESFQSSRTKITPASTVSSVDTESALPPHLKSLITSAQLHESQGNVAKATEAYRQILAHIPDDATALVSYGRLLDRENKFAEAATYYQRATKSNPNNPSVFNDLGLCYARQGNLPSSIKSLARAVQLRPQSQLYRNNIATVLVEDDQAEKAIEHLAAVHGEAIAHYNVGYLLQKRGHLEMARRHFSLALEFDSSLEPARQMLVRLESDAPADISSNASPVTADPDDSSTHPSQAAPTKPYLRIPQRMSQLPQWETLRNPPLPNGEAFLYSNSVQHLPPVGD